MLEVRLLGTFAIQCDGLTVTISSRIAQSLFAYLIMTAGTLHRREKLAGMFWPDATEEKARAYLRHELWRIRKTLSSRSTFEYLIADDIHISFSASVEYWCDVNVLEKASESSSTDDLMTALLLNQGEFLPGFYDEWITQEREHLQAVYEQKMTRLLDSIEKEKRWNDILEWAERWISDGQGPEIAYRYLMIAYDALGDRVKVAATYQRCVQALRELDLEPSEQTRGLAFKRASKLNIPIPLTSFIGREKELNEVAGLLTISRLVTLTGSGGVGKTRLAIQVVADVLERFPDGVWFLDLAPLAKAALVPKALASLLGLRESGEVPITELLINYFRSRVALVIFDNCEHLIQSCAALVNSFLTSCENLSILATSREALRVSGEIPYRVPSLEIPKLKTRPALDTLAKIESIQLFTERAVVALPGFVLGPQNASAIVQICQHLDGIPLAIELAAARTNMLTPEQISSRLDDRFNLLTGGLRTSLPRHQTLRATIEWSYDLLSEKERLLFRRLAVFMGGWTLEAAEQVCSGDGLESMDILDLLSKLVNKSMVLVETLKSEKRYRSLEMIRQFGREKLSGTSEGTPIQDRHLEFFLALAEIAEPHLRKAEQIAWLKRLDAEHENLRAALEWFLKRGSDELEIGLRLAAALCEFWDLRGNNLEGCKWLDRIFAQISCTNAQITKPTRAKALYALGFLLWSLPDYQQARVRAEESLMLYQELEDERGIASALNLLGMTARAQRDYARAIELFEQGLAISRKLDDKHALCKGLYDLAAVWWRHGEYKRAEQLFEESLVLSRELGNTAFTAEIKTGLAAVARERGNFSRAHELCQESLSVFRDLGAKFDIGATLQDLGILLSRQGKYEQATERLEESLELLRETSARREAAGTLCLLGDVAFSQGDVEGARGLYEQGATMTQTLGDKLYRSRALQRLANVNLAEGDYAIAQTLYEESLAQFREINSRIDIAGALLGLGNVEWGLRNFDAAFDFYRQSLRIRYELGNPHDIAGVLERMATLATGERKFARAVHLFAAATQMRVQVGAPLSHYERIEYDKTVAELLAALGEADYQEAVEQGKSHSIGQAVKIGLNQQE